MQFSQGMFYGFCQLNVLGNLCRNHFPIVQEFISKLFQSSKPTEFVFFQDFIIIIIILFNPLGVWIAFGGGHTTLQNILCSETS